MALTHRRLTAMATLVLGGALALAATVPTAAAAQDDAAAAGDPLAPTKVIVAFDDDLPPGVLDELTGLGVERAIPLTTIDAVAVTAPAAAVPLLAELPGVAAVTPQRRLALDLYASKQQIHALDALEPSTYTAAGRTVERPGVTGAGVTVAVIDSGIFAAHPDFGSRVTFGANFELSELQQSGGIPVEQWDAYAEATGPSALQDEVGHGTHVASTVGGDGSAAVGEGDLAGIAPEVDLVSLKIASAANGVVEDVGFEENALAAIDYMIRHNDELGVRVANNSWGLLPAEPSTVPIEETDYDAARQMAVAAVDAGITMVFSAGNDGPDFDTIRPGAESTEEVITVAAACKAVDSCEPGQIAEFSSRGPEDGSGAQVDVAAPGDNIMAAVSPSVLLPLTQCPDAGEPAYYCISGTSMAAPHVAGVAALMVEANPDITPAEVEACMTSTATDLLEPGVDVASGHGLVNAAAAVECAHALTLEPADSIAPAPTPQPAPEPAPTPEETAELPTTGGAALLPLLGLLALGGARRLRA